MWNPHNSYGDMTADEQMALVVAEMQRMWQRLDAYEAAAATSGAGGGGPRVEALVSKWAPDSFSGEERDWII